MTWALKDKAIGLTSVIPHAETRSNVSGRAPDTADIRFTPQELYGAMARCSNLHTINPDAVTFESETCRYLVAQHVDDKTDNFFILPTADRLKDFSRSHMVGVIGAGVAYLQMIRDGYVWCDHFENLASAKPVSTKRSPDFVFSRPADSSVAITECKATRGSSRAQFKGTVKRGYLEQVFPYLGSELSGAIASHGFSIGTWMTSSTRAELFVDHTAVPEKLSETEPPSDPGSVKRGNYLTVLSLMFGPRVASAARAGTWVPSETSFVITQWLGREWLLGFPPPYLGARFWESSNALRSRDIDWTAWPLVNDFALELTVARTFFRSLAAREATYDLLADVPRMDDDLISRAKDSGGAVYPDGLGVIGRLTSLEGAQVALWDPNAGQFKKHEPQSEPLFLGGDSLVRWVLEEDAEKSEEPIALLISRAPD